MASEVTICNLALSHIGANPIASLSDSLREARECKILFDSTRDSVLRDHKWSFATKRLTLALLSDTYTGWTYAYSYPTDCLVAHEIYNEYSNYSRTSKIEFEIASSSSLTSKIILTDKENAELIYTAKITDCNMFDSLFIAALAYKLAMELAIPLKGNGQLTQAMYQLYVITINQAKTISANETYCKPDESNTFVSVRS